MDVYPPFKHLKTIASGLSVGPGPWDSKTCASMIGKWKENAFRASEVIDPESGNGDAVVSRRNTEFRSSETLKLQKGHSAEVNDLYDWSCDVLSCSPELVESIQVTRYRPGGFFSPHFDAGPALRRDRTIIIYLNDDFRGGVTYFPNLETAVQPQAGFALAFVNLDQAGELLNSSLHCSTPIESGVKYIVSIWSHVKDGECAR